MQLSVATAFAILAAVAQAAPTVAPRQFAAQVTFKGAASETDPGAQFTQAFPRDGTIVPIGSLPILSSAFRSRLVGVSKPLLTLNIVNPLSVSKIQSLGGAICTFYGKDGSVTTTVGAQTVDVGPPQTQNFGFCRAF